MRPLQLTWPEVTQQPTLAAGEIHVWSVPLQCSDRYLTRLLGMLAPDEQQRSERFLKDDVRRRYVVGRGCLRQLLAGYLNVAPAEIRFQYTSLGKPFLDRGTHATTLQFNLSNSNELALIAVCQEAELGVDVEHLRKVRDYLGLARRFFAEEEVAVLQGLPAETQMSGFFCGWTRKEAILKATGTGLTTPLNEVLVTMQPDDPARLLQMGSETHPPYELHHLLPAADYTGALATPIRGARLRCGTLLPG